MTNVPFHFVDVFAVGPLTGNPVALVPAADQLPEPLMRAIAREFNQSETTFVLKPELAGASWRLRSFTPTGAEVLGAGHNALGAWIWLAEAGLLPTGDRPLAQQIGEQVLPVRVQRAAAGPVQVSMDQAAPAFGATVTRHADLAAALGLTEQDLDRSMPAQVVDTGAGHLLVAVRDRAAVDRAAPDPQRLAVALQLVGGEGCYVYSLDPVDAGGAAAYARFFNPVMGISEDPATGTAAGPLAALLVAAGRIEPGQTVIEQGHALGRPSRIGVRVRGDQVSISGTGLVVASGTLHV